ncbi:hypothetical protein GGI43DRAFT_406779 [Trichoderma evansii]
MHGLHNGKRAGCNIRLYKGIRFQTRHGLSYFRIRVFALLFLLVAMLLLVILHLVMLLVIPLLSNLTNLPLFIVTLLWCVCTYNCYQL